MTYRQTRYNPDADWREITGDGELSALIDEILANGIYALDTEFHTERTYFPRLALLQIACGGKVFLIDPFCVDLSLLKKLLASEALLVLHAGDQDLRILYDTCAMLPKKFFDTQLSARFLGFSGASLSLLSEKLLGVTLNKLNQLSDWTKRPLSEEQKFYAANDVRYLIRLYEILKSKLTRLGRLDWSEEESLRLLAKSRELSDPREAWWKIKNAGRLKGVYRGVAQEAAAWREEQARSKNIPVRRICSDLALASVIHSPLRSPEDILAVRDIELSPSDAESFFAALKRGMSLPETELRLPPKPAPDDSASKPLIGLAMTYVAQKAIELDIDQPMLATKEDLTVFYQSGSDGGLIANSWRFSLIGEQLQSLSRGEVALAFDGEGSVILEQRSHVAAN